MPGIGYVTLIEDGSLKGPIDKFLSEEGKNILSASGNSTFPFADTNILFINILRIKQLWTYLKIMLIKWKQDTYFSIYLYSFLC